MGRKVDAGRRRTSCKQDVDIAIKSTTGGRVADVTVAKYCALLSCRKPTNAQGVCYSVEVTGGRREN